MFSLHKLTEALEETQGFHISDIAISINGIVIIMRLMVSQQI